MTTIDLPDTLADCGTGDGGALPADPFLALRFHFGMLLGVDDFEVEQGFHHGKQRLHNAWLHGSGVVWGFGVSTGDGEIKVAPGLALDGAGRELHLDDAACVSVTAWYAKNAEAVGVDAAGDGSVTFDAYVTARYATCPMRPVPALAEPCAGMTADTAYSRTYESIDIRLVPGDPPAQRPLPYPTLRALWASGAPASPAATFAELAVADSIELAPAAEPDTPATRYPALESEGVLLARVRGIRVAPGGTDGSGWELADPGAVDYLGRRTLLPTEALQALVEPVAEEHGAGPWFTDVALDTGAKTATLTADSDLLEASVVADAFAVARLDGAWAPVRITGAALADATHVVLTLESLDAGLRFRVIARGSGADQVLGTDRTPLGGGVDFVAMKGS